MGDIRFRVYEHRMVYDKDKILKRQFIVLKDYDGNIVGWTDFHKYVRGGKKSRVKSVYADSGKRCYNIVGLLNYVFFDKYCIEKLTDITSEMVKDYLNDYGLCRLPSDDEATHRSKNTVELAVTHIIDFFSCVIKNNSKCKMKIGDLYTTEKVFSKSKKRYVEKRVPIFEVNYKPKVSPIFRDITEGAFQIIVNEVIENHTNILMLVACGAFAGMRPSECCNVRREDSALGAGIRFEIDNNELWADEEGENIINIWIDISEEKNLRSDLKNVGGIKRERMQKVYPAFISQFMACYDIYTQYIEGRPYEAEYGALTNTSFGKAYTYDAYSVEFKKVIKACIPKMLASDDPETVNYGHLLQQYSLSPHIFRHWFSVKLTLYGENAASLMYWRGDRNPESALRYLMDKSELEKKYEKVSDAVFNYSLWKAEKITNKKKSGNK